jgi:serine/threonine protein kinase
MATLHKAGKFANEGERRVIEALTKALPPNAHVISNLYLPERSDTLEIDALVLTALGLAVVEVKDWRGSLRFTESTCTCDGVARPDPRPLISHKAKVLHSRLARTGVRTSPVLVLASDTTDLRVDAKDSVPVKRLSDAVSFIRTGAVFADRARATVNDSVLRDVLASLLGDHDKRHRVRLVSYLLGEPTGLAGDDEVWGTEDTARASRVRLRRHVIDEFASAKERDQERRAAQRALDALRALQGKRLSTLPTMYATFTDPDDDASIWTAYEGVDGPTLLDAPLTLKEKVQAVAVVAETLATCHEAGVLHRGLSPRCLIVPAGSKNPVILNFDFARLADAETVAGGRVGVKMRNQTRIAPEVRRGGSGGTVVADVYALGITAIECLSGATFKTNEEARAAARKLRPRELGPVLLRMVDEQPGQRFGNMKDAATALRKAVRA